VSQGRVVDGGCQVVLARRRLRVDREVDIDDEELADAPLLREDAVEATYPQAV
jgi:hypothetical protein